MKHRHRTRLYAAAKPVSHHEVKALAQFGHETVQLTEVVAVVAVSHDHEPAARRANAAEQRTAIPPRFDIDHARTARDRDVTRSVRAPVVGDQDLAVDVGTLEKRSRLADAHTKRLG